MKGYTLPEMQTVHAEEMQEVQCGNLRCRDPDCSAVLALAPACHPRAGVYAEYFKSDDTLRTACATCRQPIVAFKIAKLPPERKQ